MLSELRPFEEGVFPRRTLEEIVARRDELAGPLLEALEELRAGPASGKWDDSFFAIYVVHLLAQFRETRAYRPLAELLATPGKAVSGLFGDLIAEGMGRVLASLYDGDDAPLRRLIENPQADEYVRGSAVPDAYQTLIAHGMIDAAAVERYFVELLESRLERQAGFTWDGLSHCAARLGFTQTLPAIRRAFEEGLCDPGFCGPREIEMIVADDAARRRAESDAGLIDDTIAELEWWDCFRTKRSRRSLAPPGAAGRPAPPPPAAPKPQVGRNDPCPCGSGRKFKKCCGDQVAAANARRAARREIEAGVLRVRIELAGSLPPIWRELLVPGTFTLAELHLAIQQVMPWTDDHPHVFDHPHPPVPLPGAKTPLDPLDEEAAIRLHEFVDNAHPLVYTYDFGDDWQHLVTVTRWHGNQETVNLPTCIGGESAAPPEDCGGIPGLRRLVEAWNHAAAAADRPLEEDRRGDEHEEGDGGKEDADGYGEEWEPFEPYRFSPVEADQWLAPLRAWVKDA